MQVVGIDNTSRKKFDRDEILQRAREREEQVFNYKLSSIFLNFFFVF